MWACHHGHSEIISLLLENGADCSIKDQVRVIFMISLLQADLLLFTCQSGNTAEDWARKQKQT
jgi:ankyrin repeat protein